MDIKSGCFLLLLSEFSVLCYPGAEVQNLVHDGGCQSVVLVVVLLRLLCLVLLVEHQMVGLACQPLLLCLLGQLLSGGTPHSECE